MKRPAFKYLRLAVLLAGLCFLLNLPLSAQTGGSKGSYIYPVEALSSPMGITFGPRGVLLVTDFDLKEVVFVDPQTNSLQGGFRVRGRPSRVLYVKKKIFVGNLTKKCISVFSEDGMWIEDIAGVARPADFAVDVSTNRLFVLDADTRAIKIFSLNKGQESGAIPADFPNLALLTNPTAIAWDPVRLELLVSDYGGDFEETAPDGTKTTTTIKPRIQIFDSGGNLAGTISSYAGGMMGGYRFSRPQGLQADPRGGILLTDAYSGEVLIFNRDTGALIKKLGGYGFEPGQMRLPFDLVMDEVTKDIFVTNNLLQRIEIFRQGGVY